MSDQEVIKRLSNMREAIEKLVSEYNNSAKAIDMNGRLALMNAEIYDDEYDDDEPKDKKENQETWEEKAKSYDNEPCVGINRCGAGAWFPSAICR